MLTYRLNKILPANKKSKRILLKPIKVKASNELAYRRVYTMFLRSLSKYMREVYLPALRRLKKRGLVQDSVSDDLKLLNDALTDFILKARDKMRDELFDLISVFGAKHTNDWKKVVNSAAGVDITAVVSILDIDGVLDLARENTWVVLKGYSEDITKNVQGRAVEYITQGKTAKAFQGELQKVFRFGENRARLIARDQVSKANSSLNMVRQQQAGLKEYVWSTSGDERVRPSHRANDGKTFKWKNPPSETGNPGDDIQCRCVAIGVIE